ncbi:MAG: SpoIIE family protein phosphatase [Sedimentibacter sp.]|uniref:SpoIIE family protein phosphatase n=1 Tax=Sedimentibacter sp. TaxID=1960295 RepID=UPI0031580A2B
MIGKADDKKYYLNLFEELIDNEIKHIRKNWFLFLVCFFVSRQNIIDEIFPFAVVALSSYSYLRGCSLLMLAVIVGAIFSVRLDFVYLIMLTAIFVYFFSFRHEEKKSVLTVASYSGAVLFVSKTTILAANGFNMNGLMLNALETLFVFSAVILVNEASKVYWKVRKGSFNVNFHRIKKEKPVRKIESPDDENHSESGKILYVDKAREEAASARSEECREKERDSSRNFTATKRQTVDIFSDKAKAKIKEQLLWQSINVKYFEVITSSKNTVVLSLTVKTEKSAEEAESAVELIVRNVCGMKLKCTDRVIASPNYYVLKFKNIKRIKIRTYSAAATKDGSAVSGDSFAYAGRADRYYTVLCDGIGSGHEAFAESNSAVDLLSKFLYTDFSEEQILRTLNSILMFKLTDERFVTFDLNIIDYGTKEVRLYKAGAAPTYIISRNNVDKISGKSLPLGILDNFEYSSFKKEVHAGDIIVMVSDGIIDSIGMDPKKSLDKYLELVADKDPQTIANSILSYALRGQDKVIDDMTVLVTRIG